MGHYLEMEPYYRALPEEEVLQSPALMQGMSMLCAMRMDFAASERWYTALRDFAAHSVGDKAREAKGRLAWLDIGLPQRPVEATAELFPKVFALISARQIRLPPFSVTSTLPSLMNGGKRLAALHLRLCHIAEKGSTNCAFLTDCNAILCRHAAGQPVPWVARKIN